MFLHRAAMQTPRGLDGLQLGDIDERSDSLTHPLNLGREIGERWGLADVMRWSSNAPDSLDPLSSGSLRIQGDTVLAVLGGTMMQFGSPAGHRLFHTAILPYLARQLRSEELRETAEVIRKSMLEESVSPSRAFLKTRTTC
jgi:hypothetical protein